MFSLNTLASSFYLFKLQFNRFGVCCCYSFGNFLTNLERLLLSCSFQEYKHAARNQTQEIRTDLFSTVPEAYKLQHPGGKAKTQVVNNSVPCPHFEKPKNLRKFSVQSEIWSAKGTMNAGALLQAGTVTAPGTAKLLGSQERTAESSGYAVCFHYGQQEEFASFSQH